jgi:ATP-dependent DNA helicase DinG
MTTPLADWFGASGTLSEQLPGFTYREAQARMAELVWHALQARRHAAIEAGTGIGKTFAYVVPVLVSGQRAIVSTGTRTLQDQLFLRDLPALGAALGRPVGVALLKGRANYLCLHRLELARRQPGNAPALRRTLEALADWSRTTRGGDLAELESVAEEHSLREQITSTVDNCLGAKCERIDECFVLKARRRAQAADVVIVNHHLLLADLVLKEAGFGELLPGVDAVVVDEAHQLPEIAQQFFGTSVSSREIDMLMRDVGAEAAAAHADPALDAMARALTRQTADARILVRRLSGRVAWPAVPHAFAEALADLRAPLAALAEGLDGLADASAGLERASERARSVADRLAAIVAADASEGLRWIDVTERSCAVHFTPADIGAALVERIDAQGGTWIFTSATLAVAGDFGHFSRLVGIDNPLTAALASPFDYARNARIYLPQGLPEPSDPEHVETLLRVVWPLVEAAGGGAFVLFTSYRALHAAERWVRLRRTPGPLLVQGAASRTQLLEEFRAAGDAVLLGTGSFWQGIDVRGQALRLVIIDKLPFAAPADPLVRARIDAIRRAGGNAFDEYQLPQAVLALKQGVGRLIRDFADRGLVVLGDSRLGTRAYGRLFLESLPPMPVLEEFDDAFVYAETLAPGPGDSAPGSGNLAQPTQPARHADDAVGDFAGGTAESPTSGNVAASRARAPVP